MVRFRNRQQGSQLPEVNLVPMMDVLMTVLTFFIIISMLLTTEQGVQVQLPNNPDTATPPPSVLPDPLLVKLNAQGILLNDRPASREQLQQQMQVYLSTHTQGFVVLQADPEIPYEQVIQLLGEMKDIGGDRVSLAIDQ